MTRVAVICFPGSNCEFDVAAALGELGASAEICWHRETSLAGFDAVVVPGGFAHGDYLRPGAIARFSPIMSAVAEAAEAGLPVLGICNGFQVLTEAQLLPGALMRNDGLRFLCEPVEVRVESNASPITAALEPGTLLTLPINHYEGNFTCDANDLAALEARGQVVLRYMENPNGSMGAVAGVANAAGNVVGLMPHPERAMAELFGSADGRRLLASFLAVAAGATAPAPA